MFSLLLLRRVVQPLPQLFNCRNAFDIAPEEGKPGSSKGNILQVVGLNAVVTLVAVVIQFYHALYGKIRSAYHKVYVFATDAVEVAVPIVFGLFDSEQGGHCYLRKCDLVRKGFCKSHEQYLFGLCQGGFRVVLRRCSLYRLCRCIFFVVVRWHYSFRLAQSSKDQGQHCSYDKCKRDHSGYQIPRHYAISKVSRLLPVSLPVLPAFSVGFRAVRRLGAVCSFVNSRYITKRKVSWNLGLLSSALS